MKFAFERFGSSSVVTFQTAPRQIGDGKGSVVCTWPGISCVGSGGLDDGHMHVIWHGLSSCMRRGCDESVVLVWLTHGCHISTLCHHIGMAINALNLVTCMSHGRVQHHA